ncbi:MAG TPA: VWA domain-containing protein [Pyrinomonadaceae bacterium]|jgi:VWFA-related protein|nr:VWA domain-containing protein [Pyrinomonadaceae bacterium]
MSHLDTKRGPRLLLQTLVLCLAAFAAPARAQQPQQTPATPQTPQDEVVRVESDLVNTDVMVFDKSGKFVEGLGREQFQVTVDGKPVPVAFFERVDVAHAGVASTPRANVAPANAAAPAAAAAPRPARGRYVAFFLDDVHLSPTSLDRVRKTVTQFLESGMGPDDHVMIATATGQLGFLQQFVDNKGVLKLALARVVYKPFIVRDAGEQIQMTEYQAIRIDAGDRDAITQFAGLLTSQTNAGKTPVGIGPPMGGPRAGARPSNSAAEIGLTREQAERMVRERAQLILKESSAYSMGTLSALESLMRGAAQLPGRKLVFFISDGFYLNDRNTDFSDRLKNIADAALRAGVVIYTLDARGLNTGDTDASSNRADQVGKISRMNVGDLASSQAPLTTLASDTGGRANINTYGFDEAVSRALAETSSYYRVAWKPELDEQKGAKFKRVEVSVVGRPDLTVRLPRGYMSALAASSQPKPAPKPADSSKPAEAKSPEAKAAEDDFHAAFSSAIPLRALPTVLSNSFVDVPGTGGVLTSSVQVSTDALDYGPDSKQPAAVDILGVVYSDLGKRAGEFKTRLNVTPMSSASAAPGGEQPGVIYNARTPLAPGFYMVKVAARDARGRQTGSASQWVEIPDLSKKQLTLSSLHIGGRAVGGGAAVQQIQFSVDRRFARSAKLDFLAFIYNARPGGTAVDLSANVRITRDGRAVVSAPPIKIAPPAQTDLARIPFTGVISLGQLPPGRYELELDVADNSAKTSAAQRVTFDIQ